jgi:hypothetical protein
MTGEDNLSGFILGSIKAEIDVHISAPQSNLSVTAGTPEIHPAETQARLERGKAWVTPLCVLLSLLLPLVIADFKPFIFEPLIWRIIYAILTVAAFIWLLLSIYGSSHGIPFGQRLAKIKVETQG